MANRAGLRKVTKSVRGKHGSVRRSYWVKATGAVKGAAKAAGGFVARHKGKIAGAAALAGAAYLGAKHGSKIAGAVRGVAFAHKVMRETDHIAKGLLSTKDKMKGLALGAGLGAASGADADRARSARIGSAATRVGDQAALTGLRASRAATSAAQTVANAGKRAAGRARTGVRHAAGRAAFLAGG